MSWPDMAQQKLEELLTPLNLLNRTGTVDYLKANCFPARLYSHAGSLATSCQELVTTGSRSFGLGRTFLNIRIYDFALYVDGQQARKSRVKKAYGNRLLRALKDPAFYRKLRSSSDIEVGRSKNCAEGPSDCVHLLRHHVSLNVESLGWNGVSDRTTLQFKFVVSWLVLLDELTM
jgi:hypothetical protein